MEATLNIRAIKTNGYRIELSTNIKGRPTARLSKLLTAGPSKGQYKLIEGFYFADETRRENWVKDKIKNINQYAKDRADKEKAKKDIRANMQHNYKVGDILYDSWGWEQTNIDFYEVVEVSEKSIVIEEIGSSIVNYTQSMAAYVKPDKAFRKGEKLRKPVLFNMDHDNKPHYYIKSRHGSISKYTSGEDGVYSSWYA